jgi:hypothetical protein
MTDRAELKRAYKENPPASGVYQIRNTVTGKVLLGSAMNLPGKLNGQRFQLQQGGHPNAELQADWGRYGEAAFSFEILDVLEPAAGQKTLDPRELAALEGLWLEKLRPFGDRGYNSEKRVRPD